MYQTTSSKRSENSNSNSGSNDQYGCVYVSGHGQLSPALAELSSRLWYGVEMSMIRSLRVGDRLTLLRLIWRNAEKSLQFRRTTDRKLIDVPFSCAAQFVEDSDDSVWMSFDDLTVAASPSRPRRVELTSPVAGLPPGAGLPDGPAGQLYASLSTTSSAAIVEARPPDDPATVIRLPDADERILVAPDAPAMLRAGHSLLSVVTNSRNTLPLIVRVVDWRQQTSVLQHHYVSPGVQLVLHGTRKQTKATILFV